MRKTSSDYIMRGSFCHVTDVIRTNIVNAIIYIYIYIQTCMKSILVDEAFLTVIKLKFYLLSGGS